MSNSADVIEIIITGLPQTGKSSFIHTMCSSLNEDGNGWRYGVLPVDETLRIQFLEPPVMESFDYLWMREMIANAPVSGYICMFNSAITQQFGQGIAVLETIRHIHPQMPIAIAANFQDHGDAWSADDIRIGLGIPADIPVLPCVGNNKELVREIVIALLNQVLDT